MFKNREIKVTMDKVGKTQVPQGPRDDKSFEKKAEFVLHKLEKIGVKVFFGVCAYVVLDTYRQVSVEKTKHNSS